MSEIGESSQSKRPRSPSSQILAEQQILSKRSAPNIDSDQPMDVSEIRGFSSTGVADPQNSQDMYLSSPMPYEFSSDSVSQLPTILSNYRRFDIRSDSRNVRQINLNLDNQDLCPNSELSVAQNGPQLVVWGTDVSINECRKKFKQFIKTFQLIDQDLEFDEIQCTQYYLEDLDGGSNADSGGVSDRHRPLYLNKLRECMIIGEQFLNINSHHIMSFDANLYRQLVSYPQEVIPTFDMAINEVVNDLVSNDRSSFGRICTRPYNVRKTSSIRDLNPQDINQLVTISGMVTRCSNIIAEMNVAFFECTVCQWSTNVEVDRGLISEPQTCTSCNTKFSFKLIHNRSKYTDKQQVKLQESPDDMPAGQTPYTLLLYACSDLVDRVQPGERVTVTGIYRATPIRINPKIRSVKSFYRTHIDVVHYRKFANKRLHDMNNELKLSKERIDQLIALSNLPDIYERLARSLAPSIYEHEDIKKGILLQLFGGTRRDESLVPLEDSNQKSFRSEINILLCGDPGTSKSQLLQYVYNLVPRGQYTSGKGSSAVGLTAYITKDPDTKQMVLQTGALVLSDGGICCIDEFDKMNESTRSVLHEVMEQQTLSIAKAGIVCQLNARTSVLAAANPIESQWNKNKTIMENIQLPPTLMSRFDLIFLLLDPQDSQYDDRLGKHLVSLYYKSSDQEEETGLFDMNMLKDYIGYARSNFHPILSAESQERLKHAYVEMRRLGSGKGQITAYPRQLESLIRLAEAHAKLHFRNVVDVEDVEEARRLHREAIKQSAIDPCSGKIDISILTTGLSSYNRKIKTELIHGLKQVLEAMKHDKRSKSGGDKEDQKENNYVLLELVNVFNEFKSSSNLSITKEQFDETIRTLAEENFLNLIGNKMIRLVV